VRKSLKEACEDRQSGFFGVSAIVEKGLLTRELRSRKGYKIS
jgi:hypothetical protein